MNLLSYGLLGMVAREESSGYDLMLKIQPYWQAKHSQIYPLLSRMEEKNLLSSRWIQQSDKPDKKMYGITEHGREILQEWMLSHLSAPVTRDELSLRLFCLWLTEEEGARRMVAERKRHFLERIDYFESLLASRPQHTPTFGSPEFGEFILIQKGLMNARAGLEWCQMVLGMIPREGTTSLQEKLVSSI
ncbi:PadR family transcriptional regulator [Paenibacillus sp. JX-17]|uniref:PadR family transcriptional regulator n=1 Tax=Paenibacillus lacisoli TaxID=3064525 RepID=A0ABT9C6T9_9BACL|nr:PadR family transcriptional regulator [Paenibacillus sp. JX-17]MDO7904964.1 PadR family transcriptional regulator [Paenibacillus sp. JX-17]